MPEIPELGPSKRFPDAIINNPFESARVPVIVTEVLSVTFAGFEIVKVDVVPQVMEPPPEIACAVVPLKATVPAESGEKVSAAPGATVISPFIECPGDPVTLKFRVPLVMVRF